MLDICFIIFQFYIGALREFAYRMKYEQHFIIVSNCIVSIFNK